MAVIDLALMGLLVAALVLAIIELGIGAYLVHVFHNTFVPIYSGGIVTGHGRLGVDTPGEVGFVLFCAIWTILVCAVLLAVPKFLAGRTNARTLGLGSLVVITLTMIFWLAGFAALASLFYGYVGGVWSAYLAFAVMSWLVFLALTVITLLTAFGVLNSGRAGHSNLFRKRGPTTATTTTTTDPHMTTVDTPKHDVV